MNRFVLPIVLCLLCLCLNATDSHASKKQTESELGQLQEEMDKRSKTQKQLEKEAKAKEKELKKIQKELISTASAVQKSEQQALTLETDLATLEQEKNDLETSLVEEREHFADLVLALQRLSRTPPEAFIAKPGAPVDSARAHMVLKSTLPLIKEQAEKIGDQINHLEETRKTLKQKKKTLAESSKELQKKQKSLDKLLSQRKKLHKQFVAKSKKEQARLNKLAKKAGNLKDLLAKIEKAERMTPTPSNKPSFSKPKRQASKALGNLPKDTSFHGLPVAGRVVSKYGTKNENGMTNKGISILARHGATVTAPVAGLVQFAGPFKGHDNIVVLEHRNGMISLIGGLNKLNVRLGQSVLGGEPLGVLSKTKDKTAELYYELRKGGKPVDPLKQRSTLAKAG